MIDNSVNCWKPLTSRRGQSAAKLGGYRLEGSTTIPGGGVHSSEWKRRTSSIGDDDIVYSASKYAAVHKRTGMEQRPMSNIKRKGMHVMVNSTDMHNLGFDIKLPYIMKYICTHIADGIKHVDTGIYNHNRIFRSPNSRHDGTGLFKVDISHLLFNGEPFDIQLQEKYLSHPKKSRQLNGFSCEGFKDLIKEAIDSYRAGGEQQDRIEYGDIQQILRNGFTAGNRNNEVAKLTGLFHSKSVSPDLIREMMYSINKQSVNPLDDREIDTTVDSITAYEISPDMVESSIENVSTFEEAGRSWHQQLLQSGFAKFGPDFTHMTIMMPMLMQGEVVGIIATSGVGKTTLAMNIAREKSRAMGTYGLFGSLEMSKEGLFFRAAIIDMVTGQEYIPPRKIAETILADPTRITTISKDWSTVLILDNQTTVEAIREHFRITKEALSQEGKILIDMFIDYGQLLDNTETTEKAVKVSRGLNNFAKGERAVVWILLQLKKSYVDPTTQPTREHIEGTGGWYQTCDYAIMIWLSKIEPLRRLHACIAKQRGDESGRKFDIIKTGLHFHTEDYKEETADDVLRSINENKRKLPLFMKKECVT